jgi:hypothetical protein
MTPQEVLARHTLCESDHGTNLPSAGHCEFDTRPWPCDAVDQARQLQKATERWFPYYFRYRCEYVDCHEVEQHEHGGGPPMREMTAEERTALAQPDSTGARE